MSIRITVRCTCDFCKTEGDGHVDVEQRPWRKATIDSRVCLPSGWAWKKWDGSDVMEPMCSECAKTKG